MSIIGLDPSLTHTGWVILDEHESGREALIDFGTFKTDTSNGLNVQRLILQRERLRNLLMKTGIRFLSMEAPYWQDFSTEVLYALNQFYHEVFLDLNMFVLYVQPLSLKKIAIPSMKPTDVTKHHMVHQAKTELDKHGKQFSEHVSDAYFAAKLGSRFYRWNMLKELKDTDLSEDEQRLFCGKHTYVKGSKKGITEYTGIIYRENDQFFDYSKQARKTQNIIKEITDGGQNWSTNDPSRVLQKNLEG